MPECDCENYSCDDKKEHCKTCGGTGEIDAPIVYLRLGEGPKKKVPCPDCSGQHKGW